MVESKENGFPLHTLQQWLQAILVQPFGAENNPPSAMLPHHLQGNIEKIIAPSSRLTGQQRLAVYQRGYLARLRDCMAGQFKALQYALGEELFEAFADEYLQQYPSISYTLADLGNRFGGFLQDTRPDKDLPPEQREDWPDFMIELAQLEYALLQIFDAYEPQNIKYATQNTPDEELAAAYIFHLFSFRFPTHQFFQAVQRGEKPALPFPQAGYMAVVRKDYMIGLFNLNPLQYAFLTHWQHQNTSIPQALASFSIQNNINKEELIPLWTIWREKWIELGFFVTH